MALSPRLEVRQSQSLTLDQHLKQVGLTTDDVRRAMAWKLSWQRYLGKQLTEQNLEKYFQRYHREFDGTQLRVAQILFKVTPDAEEAAIKKALAETGAQIVIPPKRNRTFKRVYDAELYKERNIIERFFNKLKHFRRVATRYDKLLANFMGFVKLAAIAIWLK